jgi:hypothetical protein
MARTLTSGQQDAAHRRDVYGVVYALTGTLQSLVSGIPDVTFYWSTKELVSGGPLDTYSGGWEPYLALPQAVTEELPMLPGDVPPLHTINILVRNLPFHASESLLTAILDGTWSWEGTDATLFTAFQRKGQTAAEIPQADWFTLRLDGQLGGPQSASVDGFTLPLASREQVRRQQIKVREVSSSDFPNADPREYGKVIATAYGAPASWVRARRTNAGMFGLTSESVVSGIQTTVTVSNDAGFDLSLLSGQEVYIHRADYVATVTGVSPSSGTALTALVELGLDEVIDINIPQGAVVQEKLTTDYHFALLNQDLPSGASGVIAVGMELLDGSIVPINPSVWDVEPVEDEAGKGLLGTPGLNPKRIDIKILDSEQPPVVIPRLNLPSDAGAEVTQQPEASVTQQPDFETTQTMNATKDNWPTGPGSASAAFDGNLSTSVAIPKGDGVLFTFPSVTGGFADDDTTLSTLKFTLAGKGTITDGGIVTFFNTTTPQKNGYIIHLGSPEDFDQQVMVLADNDGNGVQVYEIQWTHELSAPINLTRIDDTNLATSDVILSSAGEVGYDMLAIKSLVAKVEAITPASDALPNNVFEDIQMRFIDEPSGEKDSWRNESTYEAAQVRYADEGISLNFVVDRQFTWSELEADLAMASRSYAFYGPEGHELHFIEGADTLESLTPVATFNLPGTPNPNAAQSSGAPLMERTPLSQLVNTVRLYHTRDWMLPRGADIEERYLGFVESSNTEALARFGRRINEGAPVMAWPISRASYIGSYEEQGTEGTNNSLYFQSGYYGGPQQKIERSALTSYLAGPDFTMMVRMKIRTQSSESMYLFNTGGPPWNNYWTWFSDTTSTYIDFQSPTGRKLWSWGNLFNVAPFDRWLEAFLTWNEGTQLFKLYLQSAGTGGATERAVQFKTHDQTLNMSLTTHWHRIWPHTNCVIHDQAYWDTDLSEAEIQDVVKGGAAYPDISSNGGNYVSSASLGHWWRWGWDGPGSPFADLYQDHVGPAHQVDSAGWDESDIVESSP